MNKLRDYIKLAGFSFAALLIFAALVFLVFWLMINKLNPPFSATLPSPVTPSLGPYSGGLTSTVTKSQITPSLSVPSQTSPVATSQISPAVTPQISPVATSQINPVTTSQISPAVTSQKQSWKQGMMVYLARLPSGFNAMYMLNLEAGTPPRLLLQPTTNQHYYGPWLSPDSSRVVYYDINGSDGIMDLQDLSVKLFKACNSPTYSPDGNQIICGEGGHFRILDAENGDLIRTLEAGVNGWLPVFSPDGKEVAFAVFGNGNSTSLWRIDASGGPPVSLASEAFENYCPTWSPDGNWIAYQSSAIHVGSEIWIMDRNGSNKRQITSTPGGWSRGPVWSPDGKWLAFVSTHSVSLGVEYGEINVISVDTGEIHQVTDSGGVIDNWRVTWGPIK
jgi:Tol biopolymer transport system component